MMYRKFNIVLCATFAFIQWTTFCSEQKNQIQKFYLVFSEKKNGNFSDQVNVTTINDTTVTTINGDMFFHGKDDNEKNKKIKFNRNTKVAVKDMQNSKALNKEAENHFFAQNLDNENDLIYLGSSKEETVNEIIKFYNDNIKKFNNSSSSNGSRSSGSSSNSSEEQHNNNAEEEEIDLAAKWVLESVESLIGSSEKTNQQLTTFQKKVNELEEQKKSNILSDSETKELTLQIQQLKEEQKKLKALISDLNNSLLESFNKQVEESNKQAAKLERQRKAIGKRKEWLGEFKKLELIVKDNATYIQQQKEAQEKSKRLGEVAAENLQKSLDEINAKELERKNKEAIKEEKKKDKENVISCSKIDFSILDKSKEMVTTIAKYVEIKDGDLLKCCINISSQKSDFFIHPKYREFKALQDLIKQQNDIKEIKILINLQVQNDQIEAVLTVGEQEINYINLLIKEMEEEQKNQIREESSKPNQIIANGWNKSRIAVTSCGILVVLLGVLYGYMNHHNLTFSNVLHAYY